jgi:hypothetical protein
MQAPTALRKYYQRMIDFFSSDAEDSRIVQKKEREKKLVHTTSFTENGLVRFSPSKNIFDDSVIFF